MRDLEKISNGIKWVRWFIVRLVSFLLTSRDLPTVRSQQQVPHTVECWRHCRLTSGEQDDLQSFLETLQQSLEALNQDSGKYRVVVQTVWRSWSNQMIQLQGFFGAGFCDGAQLRGHRENLRTKKLCRSMFYGDQTNNGCRIGNFPMWLSNPAPETATLTQCIFPTAQGGFAYSTDKMINIRVYAKLTKRLAKLLKHPTFPRYSWDQKFVENRHTLWNSSPSRPDKKEYQLKYWSLGP